MKNRRGNTILSFIIIIAVLVSSYSVLTWPQVEPLKINPTKGIKVGLDIKLYDSNGILKDRRYLPDDLILDNFRNFLISWFSYNEDADNTIVLKDIANQDRTFRTRKEFSGATGDAGSTIANAAAGSNRKGGIIGIGNGTTAPTVSDYSLETIYGSYEDIVVSPTWDSTSGNVTILHSFNITDTITISEAAFGCAWVDSSGDERQVIFFRDTFSGVSCVNGDTFSVTYWLVLNDTGYTDIFGTLLSGIFDNVADGGSKSVSIKDDGGTSRTIYTYISSSTDATIVNWYFVAGTYSSYLAIGTDNTATDRTHYDLLNKVESNTIASTAPYLSGTDIIIETDVYCSSSRTITESAFFMRFTNDNDWSFMIWRDTQTGQAVSAGHWIHVEFTLDL